MSIRKIHSSVLYGELCFFLLKNKEFFKILFRIEKKYKNELDRKRKEKGKVKEMGFHVDFIFGSLNFCVSEETKNMKVNV